MEEEARKRRERIRQLKEQNVTGVAILKEKLAEPVTRTAPSSMDQEDEVEPSIQHAKQAITLEAVVQNIVEETKANIIENENREFNINDLAPKKPNWDLKRDIEDKMEKLDRQTKKAINELIRIRLLSEKGGQETSINNSV